MSTPSKRREAGAGHADPLNEAPGKASSEYPKSGPGSTIPFPKERVRLRRFASVRLREIYTVALYRRREDFVVDGITFVSAIAFTLACDAPSTLFAPGRREDHGKQRPVPWMGLCLETLRRAIVSAELGHFDDNELETVIASVKDWRSKNGTRLHTARRLGQDLQLTRIERDACNINTIEAVDEPKAERKIRLKAEKLVRDREKKRAERGRTPRQIYEANSISKTKPWKAEGIGRTAWYERQRTGVSPIIETLPATHLSGLTHSAGAAGETELPATDSDPLKRSENLLAVMPLKESPPMPDATAVITAIREAEGVLQAQRGRMRGKDRDRLDEVLSLLPGIVLIAGWDRDIPAHIAVCAEGAVLHLRHFANDNVAIAGIIRRIAA